MIKSFLAVQKQARLDAKKAKVKQAKLEDSKRRLPPSSSSAEQGSKNTLKALQERNKASLFNSDIENSTKTQAIEKAQKQIRKFKYV